MPTIESELSRLRDGPDRDDDFTAMTALKAMGADVVARLRQIVGSPEEQAGFRARALPVLESLNASDTAGWEIQPGFRLTIRQAAAESIERIKRGGG